MDDDADRTYRRVSRAARHKWEPWWTTLTHRSRRPRGTAHVMTGNVVPFPVCCGVAGKTCTGLKCRGWSGI
jgi:hypothetical protein